MPLNSVQLYVQGLLNGLSIPAPAGGTPSALEAYITPPTVEELDGPRAYIWGGRQRVTRQTAPRQQPGNPSTGGFKHFAYTIDIYLSYLTNPDDANLDQEFPLFVDAVLAQLWTTAMPVSISATGSVVPPGTAGASQILEVGEQWELEYPPERTPATMRMLYYTARIGMEIYEAVQG